MSARSPMLTAARAGGAYFAIVFAAGFVLGSLRVLAFLPLVGEATAVLMELPVILTVAWLASRWVMRRFAVTRSFAAALLMGGIAFALLMLAELALAIIGFGRTLSEHLARYGRWPELLGLAGQLLFAMFPAIQAAASHRRPN